MAGITQGGTMTKGCADFNYPDQSQGFWRLTSCQRVHRAFYQSTGNNIDW